MSNEELFQISLQRSSNGSYTKRALKAQRILWEREKGDVWYDKKGFLEDNGVEDRDYNKMLYDGYID